MRLYFSFLSARLRLARRSDSLLLALLHYNTIRLFALPLPFTRRAGSTALPLLAHNLAVVLEFPFLTLRVRMELLAETMLALLKRRCNMYSSLLRARLRLARRSDSLLLALLHYNTVRLFALPLPFTRRAVSTALALLAHNLAVALEFPLLALRVRMELLPETVLALFKRR